jgi:hypothetical protein
LRIESWLGARASDKDSTKGVEFLFAAAKV